MVVGGVRMFSGLAPEGHWPAGRPLREIATLCGLTLDGGIEENLRRAAEGVETDQPARRRDHLRLVTHRGPG